ncbi:MAG: TIGR01777 family protein [Chitinophagia bacterium]|nr:TIGR01777 family protein [Chitinophagia bacterium]
MQVVGITGGTGFVGRALAAELVTAGARVIIFSRGRKTSTNPHVTYAHWDPYQNQCDTGALKEVTAMINLAGAGVTDGRWTPARKEEIRKSRVIGTRFLVQQIQLHASQCNTLVSASAIGFYGPDCPGQAPFTEEAKAYPDYLGEVSEQWEAEALAATIRTVIIRIGIVLGKEAGAFPKFADPLKMGAMPLLGGGRQMISWIDLNDLTGILRWAVNNVQAKGIYNAVAPNPVTQADMMRAIAKVKGGLALPIPVPSFALQIMLGEMSIEILKSATVSSNKVAAAGYQFQYPTIEQSVKHILG